MFTLHTVLRANAASCLVFGMLFIFFSSDTLEFLGQADQSNGWILVIIGILLLVNGFHLLWAASMPNPGKLLVIYFSSGDFIWVAGTVLLIVLGIGISSSAGVTAALVVAALVGSFGLLQLKALKAGF